MERGTTTYGPGTGTRRVPSERVVRLVLGLAVASTLVHYTDNVVNIEDYPQPHWINHAVIPLVWVALTAVGIAGYLMFRRERYVAASLCFAVYSYTGLSSLAHYQYGPASAFTTKMHAGIWLDGVTGAAVLTMAVWLLLQGVRRRRDARL